MKVRSIQPLTLDERIAYALTDRKILHFRFDANLRKHVFERLTKTQKMLLNRITVAGIDALPKTQLDKLLHELQQEIAKTYQELTAYTDKELSGFLMAESKALHQLYNDTVGFDFFNQVPDYKHQAVKKSKIIAGMPLEKWWEKQSNESQFRFEATIRQGLLDGKQIHELVNDIKAVMNTSRHHANTLVITAVAKVADDAHQALRDENADLVKGEKHLATLDMRTSEVCRVRDGLMWDVKQKPIHHDVPYQRPPLHPRCRSILQLVLKSWKELGFDDVEAVPTSTRASMDGQVSENINYENWLKTKTPEQQDQVLGKGKADLWRRGIITFADMLDQTGRPLSLEQLQDLANIPKAIRSVRRKDWSEEFKIKAEKIYYTFAKEGIIIDQHGLGRLGQRLYELNLTIDDAIKFVKETEITHIDSRNGRWVRFNPEKKVAVIQSNIDNEIITFEKSTNGNKHWKKK